MDEEQPELESDQPLSPGLDPTSDALKKYLREIGKIFWDSLRDILGDMWKSFGFVGL